MGNLLSIPCTKKLHETGSNRRFVFVLSQMQGWRNTMEDDCVALLDLDGTGESSNAFFGVYDGHGGSSVAKYAAQNLHERLVAEESYMEQNWNIALKNAFLGTDTDIRAILQGEGDIGSCATTALVTEDNKIYVANAGDSRSVLSVGGEAKALSFDHKPTRDSERARISEAGGCVTDDRVAGRLSLSRAFGDFEYKQRSDLSPEAQIITADPEITCHDITEEDEFLVMACDGIWDCLSSQDVVDFVRYQVSEGKELTEICGMIFEHCLAPDSSLATKIGTGIDNMSLLIVGITHGRTEEGWYEWIKERVKNGYGYSTSGTPPQIYSESRLASSRERKEARERRYLYLEAMENNEGSEQGNW